MNPAVDRALREFARILAEDCDSVVIVVSIRDGSSTSLGWQQEGNKFAALASIRAVADRVEWEISETLGEGDDDDEDDDGEKVKT